MRLGAKVTIKPLEVILSLLDGHHEYKDSVKFNYNRMKEYCGKQVKIQDFWKDSLSKTYKVILKSATEPGLNYWVWHVDWLIIDEKVLEGDKL